MCSRENYISEPRERLYCAEGKSDLVAVVVGVFLITRAQKVLTIIGTKKALFYAVKNVNITKRIPV